MSNQVDHLTRLVHLASEPSDESRRNLLREITDVFLTEPEALSESQNSQFGEIMGQLAYDLEQQMREELANRLAAEGNAPRDLIRRLANDEISIARPVLQQSPVLSQQDLIEITQNKSQDHLHAITERPDIGPDLSQQLVTHGDDRVVVGLLQNASAEIRYDTMGEIADRSQGNEQMQTAVIDRRDVPKEVLTGLMDKVSAKLREQILDRYADVGTEELDQVLLSMKEATDESPKSTVERYIESLVRRGALTEWILTRFIAEDRPMEFMVGFAKLMEIEFDDARRILADNTGTPLAVLCKAYDFGPETFKEIALSPYSGIPAEPGKVLPLVKVYMRLKQAHAQRTVRFWKTRKMTLENLKDVVKNGGGQRNEPQAAVGQQPLRPRPAANAV